MAQNAFTYLPTLGTYLYVLLLKFFVTENVRRNRLKYYKN